MNRDELTEKLAELYNKCGNEPARIAEELNKAGITTSRGLPWARQNVVSHKHRNAEALEGFMAKLQPSQEPKEPKEPTPSQEPTNTESSTANEPEPAEISTEPNTSRKLPSARGLAERKRSLP